MILLPVSCGKGILDPVRKRHVFFFKKKLKFRLSRLSWYVSSIQGDRETYHKLSCVECEPGHGFQCLKMVLLWPSWPELI